MENNTTLDRIKLMMSYDLSKTLDQNLMENDEQPQIEVDEQTAREVARGLKTGASEAEMITKLASTFGVDARLAKLALAKEASELEKQLVSAIRKDFKNGVRVGTSNILGDGAKQASKLKAIKEIMNSGTLTEKQIISIIERNKNEAKQIAKNYEISVGKKTIPGATPPPSGGAAVPGTVPGAAASGGVKKYTAEQFNKLKEFLSGGKRNWKEILKWGLGLGLVGTIIWLMVRDSGAKPEGMPTEPPKDSGNWAPCIQNLIKNKQGKMVTLSDGTYGVQVINTEYPKGIIFYSNGRVVDGNNRRGSYKCKNSNPVISEFRGDVSNGGSTNSLSDIEITWDKTTSSGGAVKPKKSIYRDCSKKGFPYAFGCRSSQIKQLQGCLGMEPRYQTGNFGPITRKKLEDRGEDLTNGLTQDIFNKYCVGSVTDSGQKRVDDIISKKIMPKQPEQTNVPLPKSLQPQPERPPSIEDGLGIPDKSKKKRR